MSFFIDQSTSEILLLICYESAQSYCFQCPLYEFSVQEHTKSCCKLAKGSLESVADTQSCVSLKKPFI